MPREVTSYKFGESAVVPEGRPYILSIEGVDTVYSLTHIIDAAGKIHMTVDVADETERRGLADARSRSAMMHDGRQPRPHITHDIGDDDAYDPVTGLLRDGHAIRVPMREMRDANRSNAPLIINSGMRLDRFYHKDGTPKNEGDEPESRRRRRRAQLDPTGHEAGTVLEESDHRPGHRLGDAAGRATVDAAYNAMVADLTSAWVSPEQRVQNIFDAQRATADACPAGVDPRTWAYEQGVREMCDAWKKPPPVIFDANGPEVAATTRAMENLPPGRFPMSAGIGSPCDLNGERGTLQPDGSGYLVCKVTHHLGPSRSGTSRGDAMTRGHQGVTGDRAAVEAAWLQMVGDTANAWRRT
jgi:hypothetical protein